MSKDYGILELLQKFDKMSTQVDKLINHHGLKEEEKPAEDKPAEDDIPGRLQKLATDAGITLTNELLAQINTVATTNGITITPALLTSLENLAKASGNPEEAAKAFLESIKAGNIEPTSALVTTLLGAASLIGISLTDEFKTEVNKLLTPIEDEKPTEESQPDVYDLPNSTLKIRNVQPNSNKLLDEFKEMFDSDNYYPLPTSITIDSLTEDQKTYINEIFSKNNDLQQKYLIFYYANNHFIIYLFIGNNDPLMEVLSITPATAGQDTLETIITTDNTETSNGGEHFILYSSEEKKTEEKPAEEKPAEEPTIKTNEDGTKTIELDSSSYPVKWAYTEADDNGIKYDYGKTTNVTCPDGYKIIIESINGSSKYNFNTKRKSINDLHKYILSLRPDLYGYGDLRYMTMTGENWDHDTTNFYVYAQKLQENEIYQFSTIKTDENTGIKTIELNKTNNSTFVTRWAYTEGDSEGIKYDHGKNINVTCPDGYKIIIEAIEKDLTVYNFDTKMKSISDLHKYILSLDNDKGKGYGDIFYISTNNSDWSHHSRNYYIYVKQLEENEEYTQQKLITRKKRIIIR